MHISIIVCSPISGSWLDKLCWVFVGGKPVKGACELGFSFKAPLASCLPLQGCD